MLERIKNKKFVLIVGLIVLVGAVLLFINKSSKILLTISTQPPDSSIYVDGQLLINTNAVRVEKGQHLVRVFREGYLEQTRNIDIAKKTNLNIALISQDFTKPTKSLDLGNLSLPISTKTGFVSKDKGQGSLVILDSNLTKVDEIFLPDGLKVENFAIGERKILILAQSSYYLYDIDSQEVNKIGVQEIEPVISISVSPNDTILVSANYRVETNLSDIYLYSSQDNRNTLLIKNVLANFVTPLLGNKFLFVQTQDQVNSNYASVFDLETKGKRNLVQKPDYINQPIAHPTKPLIAYIGAEGITTSNYETFEKNTLLKNPPEQSLYTWADDSNLVVANKLKNTVFIINIDSGFISQEEELPPLSGKKLISISKSGSNILYYYQDTSTFEISVYSAEFTTGS